MRWRSSERLSRSMKIGTQPLLIPFGQGDQTRICTGAPVKRTVSSARAAPANPNAISSEAASIPRPRRRARRLLLRIARLGHGREDGADDVRSADAIQA